MIMPTTPFGDTVTLKVVRLLLLESKLLKLWKASVMCLSSVRLLKSYYSKVFA